MTKKTLGLIGAGAFGAFIAPHLAEHYDVVLYDAHKDVTDLARSCEMRTGSLHDAAKSDVVILAVPVQKIEDVLAAIASVLKPNALVMDVGSVKVKPTDAMKRLLPTSVDIVGLHPLFGPQSGKNGIEGLNIAICNVRGDRNKKVATFCKDILKLNVFEVTAEEHDRELAYVHGLTHMLGKVIVSLELPKFRLTTKTYDLLDQAVDFIRYDSDELFKAIEQENPFAAEAKEAFFAAAHKLENKLKGN